MSDEESNEPERQEQEKTDELGVQRLRDFKEWENKANWRGGVFYFGENDSRMWVPKRSMFGRPRSGGTPNLANPAARKFLFLLICGFVLLLALISALQNLGLLPD